VQLGSTVLALFVLICFAEATQPGFGADADAHAISAGTVIKGCALPYSTVPAHVFYVDPVHGSMRNNGSSSAPWRTLEEVVKSGLISTRRYDIQPYKPGAGLQPQNPKGVVHAGDMILLRSGNHGAVSIVGGVNHDFITIAAEKGQTPILSQLSLKGSSKWVFKGLTIQNTKIMLGKFSNLVEFLNHKFWGPTDNIIFEKNNVNSQQDVSMWTQQDWLNQSIFGAINDGATCVTIRDNVLRNIGNGMFIGGDNALVEGNKIDNFGDDAIDIVASHIILRGNKITNNHDIGDGNHNDGIQGWTTGGLTNRDILIEDNTIIASMDPTLPFPGNIQGISIFDGKWLNVWIINNVVIVNAWHGISLYGIQNAVIINNTVMGSNPDHTTWIGIFNMKTGELPINNVVRNNIAPTYILKTSGISSADHNVIASDPQTLFVDFDIAHAHYDLHLLPGSVATGEGDAYDAPHTDNDGHVRVLPIDAGAYSSAK